MCYHIYIKRFRLNNRKLIKIAILILDNIKFNVIIFKGDIYMKCDNAEKKILIEIYKLRYEQTKHEPCLMSDMQIIQEIQNYYPDNFNFEDIISVELNDCNNPLEYHAITELLEKMEKQIEDNEDYEDYKDERDEIEEKKNDTFMPSFI